MFKARQHICLGAQGIGEVPERSGHSEVAGVLRAQREPCLGVPGTAGGVPECFGQSK